MLTKKNQAKSSNIITSLIIFSPLIISIVFFKGQISVALCIIIGLLLYIIYANWIPRKYFADEKPVLMENSQFDPLKFSRKIEDLRKLDPIEFEHLIEDLFKKMGYTTQTTKTTGDEGVDLFIEKGNRSAVVQCKRYIGNVGQPVIRDLYGAMIHNHANEAYIVTTGTITLPAQQWAAGKPIHLVDGTTLLEWLESFTESNPSTDVSIGKVTVLLIDSGPKKINVIKKLRTVTNLGLREAKDLIESAPAPILENIDVIFAQQFKTSLEAEGAKIELIKYSPIKTD